jgi:hypothetical protein
MRDGPLHQVDPLAYPLMSSINELGLSSMNRNAAGQAGWLRRIGRGMSGIFLAAVLGGCAVGVPLTSEPAVSHWSQAVARSGHGDSAPWQHQTFPGKTPTLFARVSLDGRDAVRATAAASASMLRSKVRIDPADLGQVRFSWKVPELIVGSDMALRDADDAPVRVVLVFEGDRGRFSQRDAMLSELARTLTGEEMPYATLMYVWCNNREPGTVIVNPRTARIRKVVVESGAGKLNRWLDYERDIRADYERAFGEPPGALVGIGVMTDSDNTRTRTQAWYGPVRLAHGSPPKD